MCTYTVLVFIPKPKKYKVCAREDIDDGSPVHLCNKYLSCVQSEVGRGGTNVFLLSYNNYFKRCRAGNVVSRSSPKPYVMVSRSLIRIRRLCIVYTLPPSWSCGFIHGIAVTLLYTQVYLSTLQPSCFLPSCIANGDDIFLQYMPTNEARGL